MNFIALVFAPCRLRRRWSNPGAPALSSPYRGEPPVAFMAEAIEAQVQDGFAIDCDFTTPRLEASATVIAGNVKIYSRAQFLTNKGSHSASEFRPLHESQYPKSVCAGSSMRVNDGAPIC